MDKYSDVHVFFLRQCRLHNINNVFSELPQKDVSEEAIVPRKPEEEMSEGDFAAPRFTTTLQKHVDVQEGTSITLTCVVTGKPAPEITWLMVCSFCII